MADLSILETDDIAHELGMARLRELALEKRLARALADAPTEEPPAAPDDAGQDVA